ELVTVGELKWLAELENSTYKKVFLAKWKPCHASRDVGNEERCGSTGPQADN
ncbi:unnamed protein product, partial [Ectocarpus sp. 13 AM-2016]